MKQAFCIQVSPTLHFNMLHSFQKLLSQNHFVLCSSNHWNVATLPIASEQ